MSAAKSKEDVKKDESTLEPTATPPPMATTFTTSTPGYKKLASLTLEPEDTITLRARVICLWHHSNNDLVTSLVPVCPPGDSRYTTSDAKVFFNPASAQRHQGTFLEVFGRKAKPMHIQTPFSVFVKKLQGSLTRMEPCRVVTIAQGVDGALDTGVYIMVFANVRKDSRRCSPSLFTRQLGSSPQKTLMFPQQHCRLGSRDHRLSTLRPHISGFLNNSHIFAALTGSPSFASSCRAQPPAESDSQGRWILGMWTRVNTAVPQTHLAGFVSFISRSICSG
ncbi:hypothetical protein BDM02DRAFT_3193383 [Thelephora ganbajun]|uniref:Uncharacterized protein n=1 Tax=Thelephora ganbajun TaxID=370292 RepID=A0ACB6YYL3_THEGA|nr:hypothetical protein BDM02DRAFT_3193383 [Thelephora ganbajun]